MQGESKRETYTKGIQTLFLKETIGIILVMTLLAIGVSFIFAVNSSSNGMKNYLNSYEKELDSYIATIKGEAEAFGLSMATQGFGGYDEELKMAETLVKSDNRIAAAYYCHNDEALTYYSAVDGAWLPPADAVFTNRSWYTGACQGQVYVSEPYVDEVSGQFCITISQAVTVNGQTTGVVGIDFLLGEIMDLVARSEVGSGYLILASSEGTILVHPKAEYALTTENSTSMTEAAGGSYQVLMEEPGTIHNIMDYAGGPKTVLSDQSKVSGWILAIVKPIMSVYAGILILVLLIAVCSVLACIFFVRYNKGRCRKWFEPIENVSGLVPELSEGNLNIYFDDACDIEEIQVLSASLNQTVNQLKYYIQDITHVVAEIASYNLQVTSEAEYKGDFLNIQGELNRILKELNDVFLQIDTRSEQMASYAEQIQQSSDLVAEGATEQAEAVTSLVDNMRDVSNQIQDIVQNTDATIETARLTNEKLEDGGHKMKELEAAMEIIEETSNQIAAIMQTINAIANKTNLLSLNASIEAARAGEAGKGFAVVATEISALAQACSEASTEISRLVVNAVEAVQHGTEMARITVVSLQEGIESSKQSEEKMMQIQKAVSLQKEKIERIDISTEEIEKVVETNAAVAQENAASGADLMKCAQDLKDFVKLFKLNHS